MPNNANVNNPAFNFDDIISDINDRNNPYLNLIFYNIPDLNYPDEDRIKGLLLDLDLNYTEEVIFIKRLGRREENRNRPILIKLNSRAGVIKALTNRKKLPPGIAVGEDRTLQQRDLYKKIKE